MRTIEHLQSQFFWIIYALYGYFFWQSGCIFKTYKHVLHLFSKILTSMCCFLPKLLSVLNDTENVFSITIILWINSKSEISAYSGRNDSPWSRCILSTILWLGENLRKEWLVTNPRETSLHLRQNRLHEIYTVDSESRLNTCQVLLREVSWRSHVRSGFQKRHMASKRSFFKSNFQN